MKRIILGMVLGFTLVEGAFAECTYSMNGVINEAGASGFPSIVGQKASYTLQATSGQINYRARNPNFDPKASVLSGYASLPENGISAFEFKSQVISYDLPGTENTMQAYTLLGVDESDKVHSLSITYSNNTSIQNYKRTLLIMQYGPSSTGQGVEIKHIDVKPYSDNAIQNLGVYLNQNTSKYGLIINNVDEGYVGTFSNKIRKVVFQYEGSIANVPTTSTNIGKPLSMELITDHARMVSSFPAGAKDICGNTI